MERFFCFIEKNLVVCSMVITNEYILENLVLILSPEFSILRIWNIENV